MKPRIYKTTHGYDIITSDLRLYSVYQSSNGWSHQFKGVINSKYVPAGSIVRNIPNKIKRLFFTLNSAPQNNEFKAK